MSTADNNTELIESSDDNMNVWSGGDSCDTNNTMTTMCPQDNNNTTDNNHRNDDNIADDNNIDNSGLLTDDEDDYVDDDDDDDVVTSESDSDIGNELVDCLLEEGLDSYKSSTSEMNGNRKRKVDEMKLKLNAPHEERKKVVLKKRDQDYFEVLPEGWLEVTHFSGMPIYLHKQTRVCTTTKPYYLGPGSARKHEIPISAVPCLQYKREIEKDREDEEEVEKQKKLKIDDSSESNNTLLAKVETVSENKKEKSLDYMSIRNYCQKLFEFQTITIRKFKTWADRRKHTQLRKLQQRPSLPDGTKLITCPLPKTSVNGESSGGRNYRKEFVMNPAGKSFVCILHEFVQHAERVQPKYTFQELENASQPYSATVIINGMEYGKGYGSSKKQAKSEAARTSLEILIPDLKDITDSGNHKPDPTLQDFSFFNDIAIEDPRVSDLCAKAGQHSPYQILVECLRRNWGMGDTDIETDVRLVKHQKNEFIMKVGKHRAVVTCRNKREGKQRAAQAILQLLHPHITSWGSLLKLYGRGSCKTPKEKKEEEQKITELQNTACANRPNYAILNKLKEEMIKLRQTNNENSALNQIKCEIQTTTTTTSTTTTQTPNLKCVDL
ncbi:microprocessor complex subunit DGCR8-like [Oppia nitens]|uniref:microprocessor complex subunit DGCR8-like n=1 Tax=Oppia nitens TaxID=1686743 RepID=UPI0023DB416A|nr:microprocessor complex subunit DGCR8-like [Oppia nitens]